MKKFSKLSITMITAGLILFGLNWIIRDYSEPIVIFGFTSLLIGILLSFIAIGKRNGKQET